MKQDLWLVNSSLLLVFTAILSAYHAFDPVVPLWRTPKLIAPQDIPVAATAQNPSANELTWEKIYLNDIFDTYTAQETKAVKQNLVTPIPEPKQAVIPAFPEVKKQEFIAALSITLKGVIAGSDEDRNVAMIADEANKEGMYHLGEKIKDAQLIKIAHNRVVLLRANGQQETFYLRKDDMPLEEKPQEKWHYIVRNVSDQSYEVDPAAFSKELVTLGNFLERASIIGTAFQDGKPLGMRIGTVKPDDVAAALGLLENDIITSVNNIALGDPSQRVAAYESIIQIPLGNSFDVGIRRTDKDILLSYKLVRINKPRKSMFAGVRYASEKPTADEAAKMSRVQQREAQVREFQHQHVNQQKNQQTMMEIRRRILEGLHERLHHH
ncbi:hypothetical protein FJ365_00205 [Candidatus Dependentiae bacterium]|nr:hypothetical protein [Candidatus Dependentiae bacterium]